MSDTTPTTLLDDELLSRVNFFIFIGGKGSKDLRVLRDSLQATMKERDALREKVRKIGNIANGLRTFDANNGIDIDLIREVLK